MQIEKGVVFNPNSIGLKANAFSIIPRLFFYFIIQQVFDGFVYAIQLRIVFAQVLFISSSCSDNSLN